MKLRISTILAPYDIGQVLYTPIEFKSLGIIIRYEKYNNWYELFNIPSIDNNIVQSFYLKDNHNETLKCRLTTEPSIDSPNYGELVLDIPLKRIDDYVNLNITLSSGGEIWTYSNIFKIYGYDLGNNIKYNSPYGVHTSLPNSWTSPFMEHSLVVNEHASYESDSVVYGNPNFVIELWNKQAVLYTPDKTFVENQLYFDVVAPVIIIPEPVNNGSVTIYHASSNETLTLESYLITHIEDLATSTVIPLPLGGNIPYSSGGYYVKEVYLKFSSTPVGSLESYTTKVAKFTSSLINKVDSVPITSGTILQGQSIFSIGYDETDLFDFYVNRYVLKAYAGIATRLSILKDGSVVFDEMLLIKLIDGESISDSTVSIPYDELLSNLQYNILTNSSYYVNMFSFLLGSHELYSALGSGSPNTSQVFSIFHSGNPGTIADFTPFGASSNALYSTYVGNGNINSYLDDGQTMRLFTGSTNGNPTTNVLIPHTLSNPLRHLIDNCRISTNLSYSVPYTSDIVGYVEVAPTIKAITAYTLSGLTNNTINQTSCDTLSLNVILGEREVLSVYVKVFDEETETFIDYETYEFITSSTSIISFPQGVYEITINNVVYTFVSLCSIINCVNTAIKNITCGCCQHDDCKADAYNKFNKLMILWEVFYNLMSAYSTDITPNVTLADNYPLDVRMEIAKLITRMGELCDGCLTLSKPCKSC